MSLAFGQCFSKVLFVYKEFCDRESGALNFWRRLVFQLLLLRHLTFHKVVQRRTDIHRRCFIGRANNVVCWFGKLDCITKTTRCLKEVSTVKLSGLCRIGFVANFIRFPAVQKFRKSDKFWKSYREFKGGNFFETAESILLQFVWEWIMGLS